MRGQVIAMLTALSLAAGCAGAQGIGTQGQGSRQFQHEGSVFGYHVYMQMRPGGGGVDSDFLWAQGNPVITIYTRNGAPIAEQDRDAAIAAAAALCRQEGGQEFNHRSRGVFLSRGGLSFAGDCRSW